jgi:PAS domain S-box-containing protein
MLSLIRRCLLFVLYIMMLPLKRIWNGYKKFLQDIVRGRFTYEIKHNWRETLFFDIILYSTPIALIALIPSVIILIAQGHVFLPVFDVMVLFAVPMVGLNSFFKLNYRKTFVVVAFYLIAILNTAILGSFGIGSIYLLAISVFTALLFSNRSVFWSVVSNMIIYGCFALIIYFKLFNSPLIAKYSFNFWLLYSSNFMFLNLTVILIIRLIINGLETNLIKEAGLRINLEKEITEKVILNNQLLESEGHYKSLFFRNPSPMWIFDTQTLQFLQVNAAAIRQYGYTRAEFRTMTIRDIRPKENVEDLLNILENLDDNTATSLTTVKHLRKNGKVFFAEVRCSSIPYLGKDERLVIARDITDQIQYTLAIEKQNAQLREIAYMQSHIVRAPLCRILGLTYIIKTNTDKELSLDLIDHLDASARELDDVIKAIIAKTDETNSQFIYNKKQKSE